MVIRLSALLICAFALAAPASAQVRIPVYVVGFPADDDDIGRQLIFEIKEGIRGSQTFSLVEEAGHWPYIKISMATVSTRAGGTAMGYSFAYDSVDMPMRGAFITGGVQTCPRAEIRSCARSTLASLDQALQSLQRDERALWARLRK